MGNWLGIQNSWLLNILSPFLNPEAGFRDTKLRSQNHANKNTYFAPYFIMGGHKFERTYPETFLFGDLTDLKYLGPPMLFPYKAPMWFEPVRTLTSLVHIRKDTLKFIRMKTNELDHNTDICNDSPKYCIEFIFDADVKIAITIYYFARENFASGKLIYTLDDKTMKSPTYNYESGSGQIFCQTSHVVDPAILLESQHKHRKHRHCHRHASQANPGTASGKYDNSSRSTHTSSSLLSPLNFKGLQNLNKFNNLFRRTNTNNSLNTDSTGVNMSHNTPEVNNIDISGQPMTDVKSSLSGTMPGKSSTAVTINPTKRRYSYNMGTVFPNQKALYKTTTFLSPQNVVVPFHKTGSCSYASNTVTSNKSTAPNDKGGTFQETIETCDNDTYIKMSKLMERDLPPSISANLNVKDAKSKDKNAQGNDDKPNSVKYPVVICCVTREPDMNRQIHVTLATIETSRDRTTGGYVLKPLKQKLISDGLCFLIQEIYGIENKMANDDVTESPGKKETSTPITTSHVPEESLNPVSNPLSEAVLSDMTQIPGLAYNPADEPSFSYSKNSKPVFDQLSKPLFDQLSKPLSDSDNTRLIKNPSVNSSNPNLKEVSAPFPLTRLDDKLSHPLSVSKSISDLNSEYKSVPSLIPVSSPVAITILDSDRCQPVSDSKCETAPGPVSCSSSEDDSCQVDQSDCVVCLSRARDTLLLPCRHLCLCHACATVLRFQDGNCPVCRIPFKALLRCEVMRKITAAKMADLKEIRKNSARDKIRSDKIDGRYLGLADKNNDGKSDIEPVYQSLRPGGSKTKLNEKVQSNIKNRPGSPNEFVGGKNPTTSNSIDIAYATPEERESGVGRIGKIGFKKKPFPEIRFQTGGHRNAGKLELNRIYSDIKETRFNNRDGIELNSKEHENTICSGEPPLYTTTNFQTPLNPATGDERDAKPKHRPRTTLSHKVGRGNLPRGFETVPLIEALNGPSACQRLVDDNFRGRRGRKCDKDPNGSPFSRAGKGGDEATNENEYYSIKMNLHEPYYDYPDRVRGPLYVFPAKSTSEDKIGAEKSTEVFYDTVEEIQQRPSASSPRLDEKADKDRNVSRGFSIRDIQRQNTLIDDVNSFVNSMAINGRYSLDPTTSNQNKFATRKSLTPNSNRLRISRFDQNRDFPNRESNIDKTFLIVKPPETPPKSVQNNNIRKYHSLTYPLCSYLPLTNVESGSGINFFPKRYSRSSKQAFQNFSRNSMNILPGLHHYKMARGRSLGVIYDPKTPRKDGDGNDLDARCQAAGNEQFYDFTSPSCTSTSCESSRENVSFSD
ncbi:unnamed protein product [Gordionus sp. m RMFG-2023]|uniref:uncharacterized protein LOC135922641 n=1 Tax=Gordionus sp. m RMFG-2023 TaxID=3053472 RepID=UPI0030E4B87A